MKKRRKQIGIIITGVLMGLVLLFLAGNIYLKQCVEEENKQRELLSEEREKLKAEVKMLDKQLEQVMQEKESIEEAKVQEVMTQEEPEKEEGIENLGEVISNQISSRVEQGESWAVYVQKLNNGAEESIGQGKMQAASLIKLYIMGAVYENYDKLTALEGQEKINRLLHSMITVSDNDAANTLTKLLGGQDEKTGMEVVNAYCASQEYTDTSMGRMLLESNADGDNYTSAEDCGMFLERVYKKTIPHAEEMLALLKQQERTGKIPAGLPSDVETANKTGELADVENDAAIVFVDGNPYILCVMSENLKDAAAARKNMAALSSCIYENMK